MAEKLDNIVVGGVEYDIGDSNISTEETREYGDAVIITNDDGEEIVKIIDKEVSVSGKLLVNGSEIGTTDSSADFSVLNPNIIPCVYNDIHRKLQYIGKLELGKCILTNKNDLPISLKYNNSHVVTFPIIPQKVTQLTEEQVTLPIYGSNKSISFRKVTIPASATEDLYPKILVMGDSVTDRYGSNSNKLFAGAPGGYWAWCKYFFQLDQNASGDANKHRCLMLGYNDSKSSTKKYWGLNYDSFILSGVTYQCVATGLGGLQMVDLVRQNSTGQDKQAGTTSDRIYNPFYDEDTKNFSMAKYLERFRTLDDDGNELSDDDPNLGNELPTNHSNVKVCKPTHFVINLCHNTPNSANYLENVQKVLTYMRTYYPEIIVILMSIDETGTKFPSKYPNMDHSIMTSSYLHSKNLDIYRVMKSLEDENNNVFILPGHSIQPADDHPHIWINGHGHIDDFAIADPAVSGPTYHPNNIAHYAWGYALYSMIKYTMLKNK